MIGVEEFALFHVGVGQRHIQVGILRMPGDGADQRVFRLGVVPDALIRLRQRQRDRRIVGGQPQSRRVGVHRLLTGAPLQRSVTPGDVEPGGHVGAEKQDISPRRKKEYSDDGEDQDQFYGFFHRDSPAQKVEILYGREKSVSSFAAPEGE